MMLPMFLRNTWYTGYLPFNENLPFDRFGQRYNISAVVDERANFVESKYQAYSVHLTPPKVALYATQSCSAPIYLPLWPVSP
jgi:hypothetical protein